MIIHKSTIRVGTTEGCFRMIMPSLMRQFKETYNDYDIRGIIGNAEQLWEMLEKVNWILHLAGFRYWLLNVLKRNSCLTRDFILW